MEEVVKIGIVTDVHQGPLDIRPWMRKFVRDMNNSFKPDFVVELGDFIGGTENSIKDLIEINEEYSKCNSPRYYVIGNHDIQRISREQFKEIVRINYYWLYFRVKFLHVFIIDAAWGPDLNSGGPTGHVPKEELNWLKRVLSKVPKNEPIILLCHYPIAIFSEPTIDNEYELMNLFREHYLIATFTGNHHYGAYREVDGVHHICLHSMGWWERELITGSYAKVIISPHKLVVIGEGAQPSYWLTL